MAFVDYADRRGEYREVEMLGPISEAHRQRGHALREARLNAGLSMAEHAARSGLSQMTVPLLSQIQVGTTEATDEEWAALWRALGTPEPHQ
jgi:hypothetical protein